MGSEARMRVFAFFKEHPVHAFTPDAIARHLKLTRREVDESLDELIALQIVDKRYQFATAELAGLIDEMTGGV